MTNHSTELDRVFHALSDPTRRAIVMRLSRGPASVSELAKPFAMAMPTLLEHIHVLERSGLIDSAKTGRVRTCEMRPAVLSATEAWLSKQRAVWEGRFDRMEAFVASLQAKERKHGNRHRKK
jgi:DNA-binding transcriptional ArsR family regulator